MDDRGYRRNGGFGFSVIEPRLTVRVLPASEFSVLDKRQRPLHPPELSRLEETVRRFARFPVRIEISGEMPSHYGFGSATGVRLATLEAIAAVAGVRTEESQLISASGRGGTSGIGINAYFHGGLIFDAGIKNEHQALLPSSIVEGQGRLPLVVTRFDLPLWDIGICIPGDIQPQNEEEETAFFKRACPTTAAATMEVLYHVVYGAVAGALESDLSSFTAAIRAIQNCTWKSLERELYGESIRELERVIYAAGATAVGMSSLGPGLFFLGDNVHETVAYLQGALPQHTWVATVLNSSGRSLALQ